MTLSEMRKKVLYRITIPQYFYNIIVPQLGDYYDDYPVDFDAKAVVCCPLHDENTPSCRYYPETNTFYCFGCTKGGNVVTLHRLFAERMNNEKPSEDDAIIFLYKYFIEGKESENFIEKNRGLQEDDKDSEAEILKYTIYKTNLENSITFDNNITQETKKALWKYIDDLEVLIDKEIIKPSEAEKQLKVKVRNEIELDKERQIKLNNIRIKTKEQVKNSY